MFTYRTRNTQHFIALFAFFLAPLPPNIPTSCLVLPPRFDTHEMVATWRGRRPLLKRNERQLEAMVTPLKNRQEKEQKPARNLKLQRPAKPKEAQAPPASTVTLSYA